MKKVKNVIVITATGEPLRVPDAVGKMKENDNLAEVLRLIIFNLPLPSFTMEDSTRGYNIVRQMAESANGVMSIEEPEHKWIKAKVEKHGPPILGINAVVVKLMLDDFERIHDKKPKEKKA